MLAPTRPATTPAEETLLRHLRQAAHRHRLPTDLLMREALILWNDAQELARQTGLPPEPLMRTLRETLPMLVADARQRHLPLSLRLAELCELTLREQAHRFTTRHLVRGIALFITITLFLCGSGQICVLLARGLLGR